MQEQLNEKLLKELNKSKYEKDKEFVNIFNSRDKKHTFDKKDYSIPIKLKMFKKVIILIGLTFLVFKVPLNLCMLILVI